MDTKQKIEWYRAGYEDIRDIYVDMQKYIDSGWRVHTCLERKCDVIVIYEKELDELRG